MEIKIAPGVSLTGAELWKAEPFVDWVRHIGRGWRGTITIKHAKVWQGKVTSLLVEIAPDDNSQPTVAVLCPPAVYVLAVISNGGRWRPKKYCVFVEQFWPAVGRTVISIPGGDRGWTEDPLEAAQREVWEKLDLGHPDFAGFNLEFRPMRLTANSFLPSPDVTNQRVHMWRLTIEVRGRAFRRFLQRLHDRRVAVEDGHLRLHVVPILSARTFIEGQVAPDSKTFGSLSRTSTGL